MEEHEKKSLKILVVDDDEVSLKVLEAELSALGFTNVIKAVGGREAVRLAKEHHPHLIFLDIMMPDMDGGSVRAVLDESPETKGIPTVFVSSIVSETEAAQMKRLAGNYPIVAKPCSPGKLQAVINEVFSKTS